jgi:hypothetical protein
VLLAGGDADGEMLARLRAPLKGGTRRRFKARGGYYTWTTAISLLIEVRVA